MALTGSDAEKMESLGVREAKVTEPPHSESVLEELRLSGENVLASINKIWVGMVPDREVEGGNESLAFFGAALRHACKASELYRSNQRG